MNHGTIFFFFLDQEMAFTLEDGTGVAGANAYIDVAFFRAYLQDRDAPNVDGATPTDEQVMAKIILATDYVEVRWGHLFMGNIEFPETPQGLSFPRKNLYDRNNLQVTGIPDKLKRAVAEYAYRVDPATYADLFPDPTRDESGNVVTKTREKVGPIEEEKELAAGGTPTLPQYPMTDRLLRDYVRPGGRAIRA